MSFYEKARAVVPVGQL